MMFQGKARPDSPWENLGSPAGKKIDVSPPSMAHSHGHDDWKIFLWDHEWYDLRIEGYPSFRKQLEGDCE